MTTNTTLAIICRYIDEGQHALAQQLITLEQQAMVNEYIRLNIELLKQQNATPAHESSEQAQESPLVDEQPVSQRIEGSPPAAGTPKNIHRVDSQDAVHTIATMVISIILLWIYHVMMR